ncbi:MAG: DUF3703 domain-containing protein [Bacteroidota bacterium]
MKLRTAMPDGLKPYFQHELKNAASCLLSKDYESSWYHLERAHILGQPYPYQHTLVHWKMLQFGVRIKNRREIVGQIPRLLAGGVKSFVGKIPLGNTGGSNVPPLRTMDIPEELKRIIDLNK